MITKEDLLKEWDFGTSDGALVMATELLKERDNLLERNKELLKAEHDLSDAYLRIRELVSAWETPFAPTTVDVWELTESKVRSLQERNKILESSKTTQEMLDDVKKLFEEEKAKCKRLEEQLDARKNQDKAQIQKNLDDYYKPPHWKHS